MGVARKHPSQQQLRNTEEASAVMEMRRRGGILGPKVGPIGSALCGGSVHLATWHWRRCSVRTGDDEVVLEETVNCEDART